MEAEDTVGVVLDKLKRALANSGFDVLQPFLVDWYNQEEHVQNLSDEHKILLNPDALAILVGNTKNMWEPFLRYIARKLSLNDSYLDTNEHCLDEYTKFVVQEAIDTLPYPVEVYYAFEEVRTTGRCISVGTAAHVSGLAHYNSTLQRSVHPLYGPWLAFRAVIVFTNLIPDLQRPAAPEDPMRAAELIHVSQLQSKCFARWPERSEDENWRCLVEIARAFETGSTFEYSDDQIKFHYEPNPARRLAHLKRCTHTYVYGA